MSDALAALVAEGRAAADSEILLSRCTIARPGALSGPIDPQTGLETVGAPTVVGTDLPCRVKLGQAALADATSVGGDVVVQQRSSIALSWSAPALQVGDRITVTASLAAVNVGRVFTVTRLPGDDLSVLARYQVEAITG